MYRAGTQNALAPLLHTYTRARETEALFSCLLFNYRLLCYPQRSRKERNKQKGGGGGGGGGGKNKQQRNESTEDQLSVVLPQKTESGKQRKKSTLFCIISERVVRPSGKSSTVGMKAYLDIHKKNTHKKQQHAHRDTESNSSSSSSNEASEREENKRGREKPESGGLRAIAYVNRSHCAEVYLTSKIAHTKPPSLLCTNSRVSAMSKLSVG